MAFTPTAVRGAAVASKPLWALPSLADTNYFPLSGNVELTASAGQIAGSVLTAPMVSGPVTVTAYSAAPGDGEIPAALGEGRGQQAVFIHCAQRFLHPPAELAVGDLQGQVVVFGGNRQLDALSG